MQHSTLEDSSSSHQYHAFEFSTAKLPPCDDDNDSVVAPSIAPSTSSFSFKTTSTRNGIVKVSLSYATILLWGQFLSFLLAASGAANATMHWNCRITVPSLSTLFLFLLLSLFLIPLYFRGKKWKLLQEEGLVRGRILETMPYAFCGVIPLFASSWAYAGIGFVDALSDYLIVLASKYTTLTSITVFSALSVPSAMVLSRAFMGREYKMTHVLGALVCIVGIVVDVLIDFKPEEEDQQAPVNDDDVETFFDYNEKIYPNKVWGDLLAILGGFLYGAIDVLAEYSARQFGGPMEFLAMVGVWGILFSGLAAILLERDEIMELWSGGNERCSTGEIGALIAAYVVTLFSHSVGVSYFVLFSESALLNMSLLTGNFWSVAFVVIGEGTIPEPMFYAALFLIVLGICIYEVAPSPVPTDETPAINGLPQRSEVEAIKRKEERYGQLSSQLSSMTMPPEYV